MRMITSAVGENSISALTNLPDDRPNVRLLQLLKWLDASQRSGP